MANLLTTFGTLQRLRAIEDAPAVERSIATGELPTDVAATLRDMQLLAAGDTPRAALLPSSRLTSAYRVELGWGTICVKLALPHGDAMVDAYTTARAGAEIAWFRLACNVVPGAAPVVLGFHPRRAAFATDFLDPVEFPTWQSQLAGARIDAWFATELGHLLGRLHAASANSRVLQERFAMRTAFQALCVEPANQRVALAMPHQAARLAELAEALAGTRIALVHGGLTPDNVLIGPRGPVLIDADCAHYGDPMFDVASCIAALAARMATQPGTRERLAACIEAFRQSYFSHLTWEMPQIAEVRAARLVPVLIASTLTESGDATAFDERARAAVERLLAESPARLAPLIAGWRAALEA
jgi:aminoglycoside phosphotransferase (APT) family kinase protein